MLQSPFHIERDVQDERFTADSLREPTTHFRSAWMRAWEIITSQTILPFHAFEFLKCWGEILRPMLRWRPALDPCSNLTYFSSPRSQRVTFTACSRRTPSVKKPCLATILVTIVKKLERLFRNNTSLFSKIGFAAPVRKAAHACNKTIIKYLGWTYNKEAACSKSQLA